MKRLIYQVSLGDNNALYEWCIDSVKTYAKKIECDHIVQRESILKILPDWKVSNRSRQSCEKHGCLPILEKHNALKYFPEEYDQILILDADVFVKSSAPSIFEELMSDVVFGGVLESSMPITEKYRKKILSYSKGQYASIANEVSEWTYRVETGYDFWNMGVMLLNRSFYEKHLMKDPFDVRSFLTQTRFKRFIDGEGNWKWSTDQTLLNWWIRKEQMKTMNLDWRWNALYKGIDDRQLPKAHFVHFFLSDHHVKHTDFRSLEKEIGMS